MSASIGDRPKDRPRAMRKTEPHQSGGQEMSLVCPFPQRSSFPTFLCPVDTALPPSGRRPPTCCLLSPKVHSRTRPLRPEVVRVTEPASLRVWPSWPQRCILLCSVGDRAERSLPCAKFAVGGVHDGNHCLCFHAALAAAVRVTA